MASPFSLGVVIPCHKPHIPYLRECLDSIEVQTRKPDCVLVVCSSSVPSDIPNNYRTGYSFPLTIVTRESTFNAAENRNYGADLLETDAISFFDADDRMHPLRIELLLYALRDADIVLHSFSMGPPVFAPIDNIHLHKNKLVRSATGCVVYHPNPKANIHHGHVTVRKTVMDFVRFPENWNKYKRKEDSLFCGVIVSMSHLQTAYIENDLCWYRLRDGVL
jgi:glycosyltransferase involved in cell wall biosynthesis